MANCYTRFDRDRHSCLQAIHRRCGNESAAPTAPSSTPTPTFESANNESANDILARCPMHRRKWRGCDRDLTITFESDPTVGQTVCSAAQSSRDLTLLWKRRSISVLSGHARRITI